MKQDQAKIKAKTKEMIKIGTDQRTTRNILLTAIIIIKALCDALGVNKKNILKEIAQYKT